jgi:hypothetical protein
VGRGVYPRAVRFPDDLIRQRWDDHHPGQPG